MIPPPLATPNSGNGNSLPFLEPSAQRLRRERLRRVSVSRPISGYNAECAFPLHLSSRFCSDGSAVIAWADSEPDGLTSLRAPSQPLDHDAESSQSRCLRLSPEYKPRGRKLR